MSRERMLIVVGVLILASPFSGFPLSWLTWFYLAIGLIVFAIGLSLRRTTAIREGTRAASHEAPLQTLP